MTRKKIPILFTLFILSTLFIATSLVPNVAPSMPSSASQNRPQRDLALPSNQAGNGYLMNLTESVNGFKPHDLNTTNFFNSSSSYLVTPCNGSFGIQIPTSYTIAGQSITITSIVAGAGFVAVQDGIGTTGLKCGSQGTPEYHMLAINFTLPDRVNLTSVWLRYGAFQVFFTPPVIPLKIETDSAGHVPSGTVLGSGNLQNSIGAGWHEVQVRTSDGKPITLQPRTTYWLVMDGGSIPGSNDGYYEWYYVSDSGGTYDNKCVAVNATTSWVLEPTLFSPINLLSVLFVKAVDASLGTRAYSSPDQVDMKLNGTNVVGNTVSVAPSKTFFKFTTNCSVTFTANWTARFEHFRQNSVVTNYDASEGFTLWNVNFTSDGKPNPTTYPYTWFNKTFRVSPIPQFWNGTAHPPTVWNNRTYASSFTNGTGYYLITQNDATLGGLWNANWGIRVKSIYKITASLPLQVVAGLPLTLAVNTTPYSPSWCNVTFYDAENHSVYSKNITFPSTSYQLTLKLNESGLHKLFLFDRWTGGNEASFNKTLVITVLPPVCNITVIDRSSPVIGNRAELRFRFYNNSLGMGNTWMEPEAVSINGTLIPPSNRSYDPGTGNTTVYMSTASGGWHTGNNTIMVSAKSGVFNATLQTWIWVQKPLCNVTVIGVSQPFVGNNASLSFKFFNNTVGAAQLLIDPKFVRINGTEVSFGISGNVVTAVWNTTLGGWHVGLNHVNVSATRGIFSNFTVVPFTIIPALCNVSVVSVSQPILGNNASLSFKFFNNTIGATPPLINPTSVRINGTDVSFTYSSGVVTAVWNTTLGGWHSGLNYVSVSATSGIFGNFTTVQINIIQPFVKLAFNESEYNGTYGDAIPIGFKFTNATAGGNNALTPSALYVNGTQVAFTSQGGWYVFSLNTRTLSLAGSYSLNFTALYGQFYVGANVTVVVVSKIPMTMVLHLDQTSVTVGSSLSASATLSYDNGTTVEDGTEIVFRFTVTFANSTIRAFNVTALTLSGTCHAAFTATSEMKNISVEAIYSGDGVRAFASDTKSSIAVTQPSGGFPVIMVAGAGGIGALVVGLAVGVVRRRKRGKEVEYKKTAALRQAASLAQLVVVDRKSGRAVFSRNLSTEETVDPHLISGFLSANESVLQEVFRGEKAAGLKFADYGKYKVLTSVGDYVMTTLFCAVGADKQLEGVLELEDVLSKFTKEFERKYGRLVSVWDGDMAAFRGAENIVSDVFAQGISMLSPYMLNQEALAKAKLSGLESDACEEARRLSAGRGVFFITKVIEYLLTEKGVSRGKLMDTINSLVKRGIFKQLSMTEAEEIVKAGGLKR
nr:hypothetical protein [Candidatus Njordarchaeota archaeon]